MTPYYQSDDGRITLYHGDCLEILPTLADKSVDLVLTDPPYYLLVGDIPRIELFCRQKNEGWDTWGNEVDKFLQEGLFE